MRRKRPICWATMLAALFAVSGAALVLAPQSVAGASVTAQSAPDGDEKLLIGRWVRPDGGYILELKGIVRDTSLTATYFNPRQINVARAHFTLSGGKLLVFIELRDVNYPGSTYNLQYDSSSDRLKGTYFQAVEKQTFDVEFVRVK